jgi:AraC-like DNA-binding protein
MARGSFHRSLYLRQTRGSPISCEVLEIGPLMRELLVAAIDVDFSGPLSRRQRAIADLIGEELAIAPRGGSPIPMPEDRRLLAFCQHVLKDPSLHIKLEDHASALALTPKTVSRLFQREFGINFRDWRQLVQSAYALAHLAQGEPIKVIASRLGYTSSAFSVMMRRNLSAAPIFFRNNRVGLKSGPPSALASLAGWADQDSKPKKANTKRKRGNARKG